MYKVRIIGIAEPEFEFKNQYEFEAFNKTVMTQGYTTETSYIKENAIWYKEDDIETDGYFEIKNTRVITIKENEIELFKDVDYIIEYELYTDYMGSAPYYENCGVKNNVVVYKNGTMDVTNSLIRMYRSKTYQTDYSGFIEAIDDYQGQYNCIEKLK